MLVASFVVLLCCLLHIGYVDKYIHLIQLQDQYILELIFAKNYAESRLLEGLL